MHKTRVPLWCNQDVPVHADICTEQINYKFIHFDLVNKNPNTYPQSKKYLWTKFNGSVNI